MPIMPTTARRIRARRSLLLLSLFAAVTSLAMAADQDPASAEQFHASRTPDWAKETLPPAIRPFVGRAGLPEPWRKKTGPLGSGVAGIDRWQANHFVVYRPETARFLYGEYTPLKVEYKRGTLPTCEKVVAEYTAGLASDKDKAVALLTRALPKVLMHPTMAPLGPACRADRGLDDEALLQSGAGFCNEQARVFVRLCQVAGIPARMIYLFYADRRTGHTVAEFHADGRWAMADVSWFCVFPGKDGRLMSAVECHEPGENRKWMATAYYTRFQELIGMSDEELVGKHFAGPKDDPERLKKAATSASKVREGLRAKTLESLAEHLSDFGALNYPLPPK